MQNKIIPLVTATLLLAACQTDQAAKQPPATSDKTIAMAESKAVVTAQPVVTEKVETLAYVEAEDSWQFDAKLSMALRNSKDEFVLDTPSGVKLTKIPARLDKWLSRIKENGGTVKAKPLPEPGEMQTRGIFGVLLDVVLYLLGVAKEEMTYGPADDYNAILNFDKKTGEVKQIVFYKK